MKKIFALLLATIMLVTVLAACGGADAPAPAAPAAPAAEAPVVEAPAADGGSDWAPDRDVENRYGFTNMSSSWTDAWFADMSGSGLRPVLGFLGPAWLINYVLAGNSGDSYGDWGLVPAPQPFAWGGTWSIVNKNASDEAKAGLAELIYWITLDTTDTGFLYQFGGGTLYNDSAIDYDQEKDMVSSLVVQERLDSRLDFLGGQDMAPVFKEAASTFTTRGWGTEDRLLNELFEDQAIEYFDGNKTKEEAIADFYQNVSDQLGSNFSESGPGNDTSFDDSFPSVPYVYPTGPRGEGVVITVFGWNDELSTAMERYKEMNPDFLYEINAVTHFVDWDGSYETGINAALLAGGADAPDVFFAESAFVIRYTQGDYASYAMSYSELLGVNVRNLINEAQISQFIVDAGTNPQGHVVGLGFQSTGSGFIYRRDLAEQIWGDGSPEAVAEKIGSGSGNWTKFIQAAADADAKDISILAGTGDAWQAIRNSPITWIVNGKVEIDAQRMSYLDTGAALWRGEVD
jgi:hypothetical protein